MKQISELSEIISNEFKWNKSRIDCFVRMLIALFRVCTVNMQKLAVGMEGPTQKESRNKRVRRFFANFTFDMKVISKWIFNLFFLEGKKYYIAIDRTNWKWGKKAINIFMLSICFEGISIPIIWSVCAKEGSSSAEEQIEFCNKFIEQFGKERIEGILADREFGNKDFVSWLMLQEIPFYIRIKGNTKVSIKGKKYKQAQLLFKELQVNQHTVYQMKVELFGHKFFLAASKNTKKDFMIVLTNAKHIAAVATYLRRWEVENLFQALKGRGFNFEETHVTHPERIEKIMALLAVGIAWAHKIGEWQAEIKPIPMKLIHRQYRPQHSYFRYGLDFIRDVVTGFKLSIKIFRDCLKLLHFQVQEMIS